MTEADAGFIVELFEGGPWLAQDGGVTIEWAERGVWTTGKAAQVAADKSISAAPGEAHLKQGDQTTPIPVEQCTRGGARRELTSEGQGSKSVT
jgi:hypothetical protein